jgi:hypothetical protein
VQFISISYLLFLIFALQDSKLVLVRAEVARIKGDYTTAQDAYDSAIEKARDAGALNVAGVANELAMKFYIARKMERAAKVWSETEEKEKH